MNEKYRKYLDEKVIPWLEEHTADGFFDSFDGLSIHYHEAVHPGEKAAIVMVHGFCEFFGKYHETAYRFYDEGYSVFFLELRGHGKSARVRDYEDQRVIVDSFDEYVGDIHSFVEKIVIPHSQTKRLYLYAHSMGGAAGAMYIEKYPDIFRCAVLSSPMLKVDYGGIPDPAIDALAVATRMADIGDNFALGQHEWRGEDHFLKSSCMDRDRYEYQFEQRMNDIHYQTWGGTWGWAAAARKATETALKDASRITTPVLIAQAGHDAMVDNEGQNEFRRLCNMVYLVRFEGAEHELFNGDSFTRHKYYKTVLDYFRIFTEIL